MEATGKTVKDAIERGAQQLGYSQDDLDIQVLEMGSSGLFGLFGKPAKVRLTVKEKDDGFDVADLLKEQTSKKKEKPAQPKQPKENKEQPKAKDQPKPKKPVTDAEKAEEPKIETEAKAETEKPAKPPRQRKPKQPKQPREEKTEEKAPEMPVQAIESEPFVETPEDQLTEHARKAREFLSGLTEKMGVPMTTAICETEGQIRIVMSGENMSILIGRRGETLDGLQYLTSLVVNRGHDDYIRVSLDTENYRAKREEALRKLAVRMAGRCKKSGRRVAMEPMNPYERRILHSALQADPEVTTHSEGEEPYRRVIITLK